MSQRPDEQCVWAAQRGDRDAIRALWRAHRRWVAGVLLAHKPREAELEDLLQEIALKMVQKIGTVRDGAAIEPWLRTVAINTAMAAGRTETRRRRFAMRAHAEATDTADSAPAHEHACEDAQRLLDLALTLGEHYREPLILRCIHAMSYRRIGLVMGLSEQIVQTRVSRARRMLREMASQCETRKDGPAAVAQSDMKIGSKP